MWSLQRFVFIFHLDIPFAFIYLKHIGLFLWMKCAIDKVDLPIPSFSFTVSFSFTLSFPLSPS